MCGIAAQVGQASNPERGARVLQALEHRGPDGGGTWTDAAGMVWLGHRRLSIVDLSDAGRQPMHNENRSIHLVCNGEIYNAPTLRARLEGSGHRFASRCDSEVVIHAYEQWGEGCLDRLEGMFAFALWDENEQRLLAARDRVGMKPLYYALGEGVALASEIGGLLPLLTDAPQPDPRALAYFMTLGYVPSPLSMWKGVSKLEPGHLLTWTRSGRERIRRYWEPPDEIEAGNDPAIERREWEELCHRVVAEHLLSDVPVGLFLSSGIDSTALAAALKEIGRKVTAITVGVPGATGDERAVAAETAQRLGFPHRTCSIASRDVYSLADGVVAAFDEPQSYSALLSMDRISAAASNTRLKVVLSGDGGDEVFGGYAWYEDLYPIPTGHSTVRSYALRLAMRGSGDPRLRHTAAHQLALRSPLHRHAWRLHPRFLPDEARDLMAPLGLRFDAERWVAPLASHYRKDLPLQTALQRVDLMTFCSDSILAKVDRAAMAHSLEVRVPWLDRRIVEWGLRRPGSMGRTAQSKRVLRRYLRGRVPKQVLEQPKRGFSVRVTDGFDTARALSEIQNGPWVAEGYWTPHWQRLLAPGMPFRDARVWNLWILTRWAEAWFPRRMAAGDFRW